MPISNPHSVEHSYGLRLRTAHSTDTATFNGFSRAEIEAQCREFRALPGSSLNKGDFMVLKNADGTDSNTCVKMAGIFEANTLRDEEAWMSFFKRNISNPKVRILTVYGRFKDHAHNEYLVYEYRPKARTVREILDHDRKPLSLELAEKLLEALVSLRNAHCPVDLSSGGLTPLNTDKGNSECWTPRGYLFADCESNRAIPCVQEKLDYLGRIFQQIQEPVPDLKPVCINHGDFSSHNVMVDDDGAIIPLNFSLTSYGPWWEDAFALSTCDKPDFTEPIACLAGKFKLEMDSSLHAKLNNFRLFHSSAGFTYDRHDAEHQAFRAAKANTT